MSVREPPRPQGLTPEEVALRVAEGRTNAVIDAPSRTIAEIVWANVVTPVNGIILTLFVLIMAAGFWKDGLFVGVIVANSVIGIAQEVRARKELNRLAVLNAPRAHAMRSGSKVELDVAQVVEDDVLLLSPGYQAVVDGDVLASDGLELDESLLTGESDPVDKEAGDEVMSGSFVAAGSGFYRASRVGADSYASQLTEEARRFTLVNSDLRAGVNRILRWLAFLIPPAAALLLVSQLRAEDSWQRAIQGTVAAAVAMVPDGLVLLTSVAFVAGVLALARRRALAKELATVELLARVDMLCLDKTGTITSGEIEFAGIEPVEGVSAEAVADALGALAASDPSPNATMGAVAGAFDAPVGWRVAETEPFSSARKWSAAVFAGRGAFFFGAPDVLLTPDDGPVRERAQRLAEEGKRVLLLARAETLTGKELPGDRVPLALILLEDAIRPDASEILAFFRRQGVALKVISGDHPATVAAVARRAGIPNSETGFDARALPESADQLGETLASTSVFGRVTPQQKRAMVQQLQADGHTVAMTGDGVNDVLALKEADMGIAMGSGSAASRAVAQLVLLDNAFATLPRVLAEGRKVINNIERVANLFVTKASYAVLLTLMVGVAQIEFPFLPRQLTLIGSLSIGVPGFFLALAASTAVARSGFLDRVLRFSIPSGIVAAIATLVVYEIARQSDSATLAEARTLATMTLFAIGLVVLVVVARPLQPWKLALAGAMGLAYGVVLAVTPLREYFELDLPPGWLWGPAGAAMVLAAGLIVAIPRIVPGLQIEPEKPEAETDG